MKTRIARTEKQFFLFSLFFRLKDFAQALKHIADIIERGIRDHPELSVGMQTEGIEVRDTTDDDVVNNDDDTG